MPSIKTPNCDLNITLRPVDSFIPYARNARTHSDAQVAQIAASIKEFGWTNPILVDGENGVIAGHGRLLAARMLGLQQVPAIELAGLSDAQRKAYIIADNRLALNAGWDFDMLAVEIDELRDADFDLTLLGFEPGELADLIGNPNSGEGGGGEGEGAGSLASRFMVPPFSVLNAREGWWQERKRGWLAMGIQSELGRDTTITGGNAAEYQKAGGPTGEKRGEWVSIFDPVLCELAYSWFSPAGGTVLDPFAGGSVRGIVAAKLGRQYIGCDLRAEQVEANREQAGCLPTDAPMPVWHCGDSLHIGETCKGVEADFLFTCPPYADLERYSDEAADLSTMEYPEFRAAYAEIIHNAAKLLKKDRFACIVVGEVRDKKGNYYNFVGDTVQACQAAGLHFYNEAILVTAVGSLPIRAGKQFSTSRKLGKTHQNVLVFVKGDGKKAAAACGQVEIADDVFPPAEGGAE